MIWGDWLTEAESRHADSPFQYYEYHEKSGVREHIGTSLAQIVYNYHSESDAEVQTLLKNLHFPRTAATLQGEQRPREVKTRRGNFAEIMACEFANTILGYEIPVKRLRLNPNIEQSMKGEDVLGFKFKTHSDSEYGILIGEAKYRTTFKSDVVKEAYDAVSSIEPRPHSISFVSKVLKQRGENSKAEQVTQIERRLTNDPSKIILTRLIVLMTESWPQKPFKYIQKLPKVVDNLIAVCICLGDEAATWIDSIYESDV